MNDKNWRSIVNSVGDRIQYQRRVSEVGVVGQRLEEGHDLNS